MTATTRMFDNLPVIAQNHSGTNSGFAIARAAPKKWPIRLTTIVVFTIVLTSPIPLASNHPLAWLFWAIILGVTGSILAATITPSAKLNIQSGILLAFGTIFVGWAVFQALPLLGLQGGLSVQLPSGTVVFNHLSIAPGATFLAAIRQTSYLLFFWLVLIISRNPGRAKHVGYILFYGVALHATVAIISLKILGDFNFISEKFAYHGKATGTFINKNSFATFLGMGLVLGLSLHLNSLGRNQQQKPWLWQKIQRISLFTIFLALMLTQSRMGIAATLTASLFIIRQSYPILKLWPAIALATLAIVISIAVIGLNEAFLDLTGSANARFELYKQVSQLIAHRPLTGFGIDSFPLAFELFHAPGVTAGFVWDKAHSTYFTLWAEGGLLFGSIPIIAGVLAGVQLWQRSNTSRPGQSMALAGVAVILLAALHSLVDFSLEIQANAFLFLAIIALGLGPEHTAKGNS